MKDDISALKQHKSVLLDEVVTALRLKEHAHLKHGARYIDATLGMGGHATEIINNGGIVLGLDTDLDAISAVSAKIKQLSDVSEVIHGNFRQLSKIAHQYGFTDVSGILFDLGVSSPQLFSEERGFSFNNPNTVLDMRLDRLNQSVTAADLLNALSKKQLLDLFSTVLPYISAREIADQVIRRRSLSQIKTVEDFLECLDKSHVIKKKGLNQATLPFMALRIAVNSELDTLKETLPQALELLAANGRLVVISFHSGEDTIVKHQFSAWEKTGIGRQINKDPIIPSGREITENPRARSAKLRIFEKI